MEINSRVSITATVPFFIRTFTSSIVFVSMTLTKKKNKKGIFNEICQVSAKFI